MAQNTMTDPTFSPLAGRPLVAIAADRIERHQHPAHALLHGYVRAVSELAAALPLALPAAPQAMDAESLIHGIDGIVLTGSPSNVAPERYGAAALPDLSAGGRSRGWLRFSVMKAPTVFLGELTNSELESWLKNLPRCSSLLERLNSMARIQRC